jgi:hypothetical protein
VRPGSGRYGAANNREKIDFFPACGPNHESRSYFFCVCGLSREAQRLGGLGVLVVKSFICVHLRAAVCAAGG